MAAQITKIAEDEGCPHFTWTPVPHFAYPGRARAFIAREGVTVQRDPAALQRSVDRLTLAIEELNLALQHGTTTFQAFGLSLKVTGNLDIAIALEEKPPAAVQIGPSPVKPIFDKIVAACPAVDEPGPCTARSEPLALRGYMWRYDKKTQTSQLGTKDDILTGLIGYREAAPPGERYRWQAYGVLELETMQGTSESLAEAMAQVEAHQIRVRGY